MENAVDRYRTLISTQQLAECLFNDDLIVLDCRYDLRSPEAGEEAWAASHIPNARYVHLDADMAAPISETSGRHPLPEPAAFQQLLERLGITPDFQVAAYDGACGAFAGRMWWMMRWIGHEHVAVLDGGLTQWLEEDRPMNSDIPEITPSTYPISPRDELWISTEEVAQNLDAIQLIDARDPVRFSGESEPLDAVGGHIPGACNLPFRDNLDDDGCFLNPAELRARFADLLADSKPICHSCGSGVTACHNLLAMSHAGLEPGRLYVGSWSEWIRDPQRPVITPDS